MLIKKNNISDHSLELPYKFALFSTVLILILLISGFVYYRYLNNNLELNYYSALKTIANAQNERIDGWFLNWNTKLQDISVDSSLINFLNNAPDGDRDKILKKNIDTHLGNYIDLFHFSAIDIRDSSGKIIFASGIKLSGERSYVKSGINNSKIFSKSDSLFFAINTEKEIRLIVIKDLVINNLKVGSIYAEILTDAAFAENSRNILIKNKSEADIYLSDIAMPVSLRSLFYKTGKIKSISLPEKIISSNSAFFLIDEQGFIEFNDNKNHLQTAYVKKNNSTGWLIVTRDINKEDYAHVIRETSRFLLYVIITIILLSIISLIIWVKMRKLYYRAVKIDGMNKNLIERFEHFTKSSNDIVILLSARGKIVDCNEKALKVYSYSEAEMTEMAYFDLTIKGDYKKIEDYFNDKENQSGIIYNSFHRKKDGNLVPVECSLKPITIDGIKYQQGVIRDKSEKKLLESKLKEKEEIFSKLISYNNDIVFIYTREPKRKFEFISDAIELITGHTAEEFYSELTLIFRIVIAEDRYKLKQILNGEIFNEPVMLRFSKKDGSIYWTKSLVFEYQNPVDDSSHMFGVIRDITSEVLNQKNLQEKEESFKYMFDNNPLPMWVYDSETKNFISINSAALTHYGYSKDEFLQLSLSDILIGDNNENEDNSKAVEKNLKTEQIHKCKNGDLITVEVRSHHVHLNGFNNDAVLEVIQDITERKRIETRIQESEKRFKTLTKISPVGIFRMNSAGSITYVNENWAEMTGVYPEIAFGKKWWESLPIKNKQKVELYWKRSNERSDKFETELELFNVKSKVNWVLAGIVKIVSGNGKIMGYVGTLTDITRMKTIEGNFRKLYFSVEQSPVSVVITDIKGNIEYVNPAVVKTTGYLKEELIGNNPRLLNSGTKSKDFYKQLWDRILSGKVWQGEFYNKRKDGSFYWEQASISPVVNERNEITNFVAVKEDITLRKELEQQLQNAKNEALTSSRIKTNFLTKINREMRMPLVGIIGSSQSIYDFTNESRIKELSSILLSESGKLNDALKSILSFSSLETEKQDIQLETVDLKTLLKAIQLRYEVKAEEKKIYLNLNLEAEEVYVKAKYELLFEAVSSLVENAIKYTNQGSVSVSYKLKNDYCVTIIKDTGVGISEEDKKVIFEPFMVLGSDPGSTNGIGLGLPLAKKYVELMDGTLNFESKPGLGSVFFIALKVADNVKEKITEEIVPITAEKIQDKQNPVVLIVEDDDINMKILKMYLGGGYVVHTACDSSEALNLINNIKFDLVLMDIGLKHGLSGIELTKILKKMPDYEKTPIVAITAFTQEKDKKEIFNAGCTHYLAKPFTKKDLMGVLKVIFNYE